MRHKIFTFSPIHTSVARSKLVHSSALGKKSPYSCQKLPSTSNANKRRHANLRSQSVCHGKSTNCKRLRDKNQIQKFIPNKPGTKKTMKFILHLNKSLTTKIPLLFLFDKENEYLWIGWVNNFKDWMTNRYYIWEKHPRELLAYG